MTRDAGQACVVRDDFGVHNFSQGACVFRHNTFLVLCVHGDYVELDWYRQQVGKGVIMQLRG